MDVARFCGCRFSCARDVGTCPDCGEYVTLSRVSDTEEKQMRAELDLLLTYRVPARESRVRRAGGGGRNEE
jgi:predicted ATP-dependent serine protease